MDAYEYGRNIKLVEDLKGNFPEKIGGTFIVWGNANNGTNNLGYNNMVGHRLEYLANDDYQNGDVLLMLLTSYDEKVARLIDFTNEVPLENYPWPIIFLENPEDYRTIGRTSCVLRVSDGYAWYSNQI